MDHSGHAPPITAEALQFTPMRGQSTALSYQYCINVTRAAERNTTFNPISEGVVLGECNKLWSESIYLYSRKFRLVTAVLTFQRLRKTPILRS